FGWIEVVLLGEIMAFVLFSLVLGIPRRPSLSGWVAFVRGLRPHPRPFEWLALAGIASIAALVFCQATTARIIETDALIYHAPHAFLATHETTLVMFGALGFLALLKATRAKRPGYAIVGGLLLGGAALTSYQGLYFILPVVVLYAIALLRRWNVRLRAFRQAE